MRPDSARDLIRKTRQVHGWLSSEAAMLFACINQIQRSENLVGDVLEIGVHHGKTALFLGGMLDPSHEKLTVCDLFGNQAANVSGSGSGDRQIFERHWREIWNGRIPVQILERPSTELAPEDVGTHYRFVHIDGGHTREEALSDLRLAARVTVETGVIALDDPLTPEWPGVAEAVIQFLTHEEGFCAIAAGFNKMLLVGRGAADRYTRQLDQETLRREYGLTYPWHFKQLPFMGHPLRIFHVPSFVEPGSVKSRLIRYYHTHPWLRHPLLAPATSLVRRWARRRP